MVPGRVGAETLKSDEPLRVSADTVSEAPPTLLTATVSDGDIPGSTWPKSITRGSTSMSGTGSSAPVRSTLTVGSSGSLDGIWICAWSDPALLGV